MNFSDTRVKRLSLCNADVYNLWHHACFNAVILSSRSVGEYDVVWTVDFGRFAHLDKRLL